MLDFPGEKEFSKALPLFKQESKKKKKKKKKTKKGIFKKLFKKTTMWLKLLTWKLNLKKKKKQKKNPKNKKHSKNSELKLRVLSKQEMWCQICYQCKC